MLLKIPDVRQRQDFDCGAACIEAVCRFHGVHIRRGSLANPIQGLCPDTLEAELRALGFRIVAGTMTVDDLRHFARSLRPVICPVEDYGGHWLVVRGIERGRVYFHCPTRGPESVKIEEWEANWSSETRNGIAYSRWAVVPHLA